jgi:plasmid stabilization system protein ParE
MELKWTIKALSDLARLYEFLAPVNQPAAARVVQSLTNAPTTLLTNPRIGEQLFEFEPREIRRILVFRFINIFTIKQHRGQTFSNDKQPGQN